MNPLGLYVPGSSPVHRLPAGPSCSLLLAAGAGSLLLDGPWQVTGALALVVVLYAVAGLPLRLVARQLRPLLWVGAFTAVFHVLVNGWQRAFVVVGVLAVLVLLAALVTLTTRTTDMVDAVVAACRPLRVCASTPSGSAWSSRSASGACPWCSGSPRRSATPSGPGPHREPARVRRTPAGAVAAARRRPRRGADRSGHRRLTGSAAEPARTTPNWDHRTGQGVS